MIRNIIRHVLYIVINIIVIALLVQIGIAVSTAAFDFGRDSMIEFLAELDSDEHEEYESISETED